MHIFKDRLLLIVCALAASIFAWLYFYFSGEHAFYYLIVFSWVGLFINDLKLRKKLKQYEDRFGKLLD
jgi:H+/gluconate symporter-like permease